MRPLACWVVMSLPQALVDFGVPLVMTMSDAV